MPNGTYGGVRGKREFSLLDFMPFDILEHLLDSNVGVLQSIIYPNGKAAGEDDRRETGGYDL